MPAIAPTFRAAASAPSPVASEWRTSRANVGKTVMLENPNTSPTMTTSAMSATSRFRAMSVIDRRRLGGSRGSDGRRAARRARRPASARIAPATADMTRRQHEGDRRAVALDRDAARDRADEAHA